MLPHLHEGLAVAIYGLRAWTCKTSERQPTAAFACFSHHFCVSSGLLILGLCNEALLCLAAATGETCGFRSRFSPKCVVEPSLPWRQTPWPDLQQEARYTGLRSQCIPQDANQKSGKPHIGAQHQYVIQRLRLPMLYLCLCSACLRNLKQVLTGCPHLQLIRISRSVSDGGSRLAIVAICSGFVRRRRSPIGCSCAHSLD